MVGSRSVVGWVWSSRPRIKYFTRHEEGGRSVRAPKDYTRTLVSITLVLSYNETVTVSNVHVVLFITKFLLLIVFLLIITFVNTEGNKNSVPE